MLPPLPSPSASQVASGSLAVSCPLTSGRFCLCLLSLPALGHCQNRDTEAGVGCGQLKGSSAVTGACPCPGSGLRDPSGPWGRARSCWKLRLATQGCVHRPHRRGRRAGGRGRHGTAFLPASSCSSWEGPGHLGSPWQLGLRGIPRRCPVHPGENSEQGGRGGHALAHPGHLQQLPPALQPPHHLFPGERPGTFVQFRGGQAKGTGVRHSTGPWDSYQQGCLRRGGLDLQGSREQSRLGSVRTAGQRPEEQVWTQKSTAPPGGRSQRCRKMAPPTSCPSCWPGRWPSTHLPSPLPVLAWRGELHRQDREQQPVLVL